MHKEISDYLKSIPENRQQRFMSIHKLILQLYPEIHVDMSYKMPTYKAGDGWVALANQKNYISLYTCGESHLNAYKHKHPTQKTGKGCINFKQSDTVPVTAVRKVIRHAIEHPKESK